MGRSRYKFGEAAYPHFLTCTVVGWLPVFTRPETVQILLDSWRFLQDQNRLVLLGYVVLENHVHFIASAKDLSKEVGDFKSYTARRIIDYLRERHVQTLIDGVAFHRARHKLDRPYQPLARREPPKAGRHRGDAASEAGVNSRQPREARVRGATRLLGDTPAARNYARIESLGRRGRQIGDVERIQDSSRTARSHGPPWECHLGRSRVLPWLRMREDDAGASRTARPRGACGNEGESVSHSRDGS